MNATDRRERLRAALAGDELIYPAPVYDPISARIADMLGFEIGFMPPAPPAASELCAPSDMMLLTLTELAQRVRRICRVSDISLLMVAENGYGNALNVMRTVEELENAGVSGLIIYDLDLPFAFGTRPQDAGRHTRGEMRTWGTRTWGSRMISLEEAVGKMKAALAAREDPSLVIAGRTMALQLPTGAIEETVRRVKAYDEAGVDAIHLSGLTTLEELEAVHEATKLPIVTGRALPDTIDRNLLAANGLRSASAGHLSMWASVQAMYDTLKALHEGKTQSQLRPSVASPELMAEVTRQAQYNEWIRSFLN